MNSYMPYYRGQEKLGSLDMKMAPIGPDYSYGQKLSSNFSFQKRLERIDWKKLASIDVDSISRNVDFNALQDNILNVAFCNIESELDVRMLDPNFIKLFKLAQLTIEYLLFSQDYLYGMVASLEEKLKTALEEHEETKNTLAKQKSEMEDLKKESHKRKKMLIAQQHIMNQGSADYNKCMFCPKAFVNQTFLQSHMIRRHPDMNASANLQVYSQYKAYIPADSNNAPLQNSVNNKELEQQLRDLQDRLRLAESQLISERNARNDIGEKVKGSQFKQQEDLERQISKYTETLREEHKSELARLENLFGKQLREAEEKRKLAEEKVETLQRKRGAYSNLGRMEDEVEPEAQQVKVQEEFISQLQEQLHKQQQEQDRLLLEKEKQHQQDLKQKLKALENLKNQLRKEESKRSELESEYQQQLDHVQQLQQKFKADQVKLKRQEPTSNRPMSKSNETKPADAVSSTPIQSIADLEDDSDVSDVAESDARDPVHAERTRKNEKNNWHVGDRVDGFKNTSNDNVSTRTGEVNTRTGDVRTKIDNIIEDDEEDEDDEEEDTTEYETSTVATSPQGTLPLGTGTLSHGTLSLTGTLNKKTIRLLQQLEQDPQMLEALKAQLAEYLDDQLQERGIPKGTQGLPNKDAERHINNLKKERQQVAQMYPNIYDIRQQIIREVDAMAKEKVAAQKAENAPKPNIREKPSRPGPPAGPTKAGVAPSPKLSQTAPQRSVTAPTASVRGIDRSHSLSPTPAARSPAPRPAPRGSAGKLHSSVQSSMTETGRSTQFSTTANSTTAFSTTGYDTTGMSYTQTADSKTYGSATDRTESQWDSEEEEDAVDQVPMRLPRQQQHNQDNDDEESAWDDDDVSDLEDVDVKGKVNVPTSTPVKPKGSIVADLTRSIEFQLQNRGKKPTGGVNTLEMADRGEKNARKKTSSVGFSHEDDDIFDDLSSLEDEPTRSNPKRPPSQARSHLDTDRSTNTLATSMWGGSSQGASNTIPVNRASSSAGRSSLLSVTDFDISDDDLQSY